MYFIVLPSPVMVSYSSFTKLVICFFDEVKCVQVRSVLSSTATMQYLCPPLLFGNGPVVSMKILSPGSLACTLVVLLIALAFVLNVPHPAHIFSCPCSFTP